MEIEIIARAVILNRGRILLCRIKGSSWYFLPGGHVESQEKVTQALRRELKEELRANIRILKFIGAVENFYEDGKRQRHEVNLVFQSKLAVRDQNKFSSRGPHSI